MGTRRVSGTAGRSAPPAHDTLVGDDNLKFCRLDNDGRVRRYGKYLASSDGASDNFGYCNAMEPKLTKRSRPHVAAFLVDGKCQYDCR